MTFPLAKRIIVPRPYVRSEATDIRKTFARVKREQAERDACVVLGKVVPLKGSKS